MLSNIILFSVFVVAVSETSLRSDLRERFSTWMSQFNINFENYGYCVVNARRMNECNCSVLLGLSTKCFGEIR